MLPRTISMHDHKIVSLSRTYGLSWYLLCDHLHLK